MTILGQDLQLVGVEVRAVPARNFHLPLESFLPSSIASNSTDQQ
jgi:hypothetical protein